jgi:NAD(P)-dependent dehydrogenase (short-subunit alcohol dehydrogenase family)
LVEQTLAQFGRIDVLVNNAGIGGIRPFFKEQATVLENILKCMYFQNLVLKENAFVQDVWHEKNVLAAFTTLRVLTLVISSFCARLFKNNA